MKRHMTTEEKARIAEKTIGLIELDNEDLMSATGAEESCTCTCTCCTCCCCTCGCGPEPVLV